MRKNTLDFLTGVFPQQLNHINNNGLNSFPKYYIHKTFQKELLSTWTADIVKDAFAGAWFINFMDGRPSDGNRAAGLGHVRLVRSME